MRGIDGILLTGRILMAASFLPAGIAHLSNISGFAVSLGAKGLPYANVLAAAIVLAELFGPLALLLGVAPRIAATLLAAATLVTTGTLHRFWEFSSAAQLTEQTVFLTQLGIVAGLLFFFISGPGAFSWQAWWHTISGEKRKPAGKKKASRPRSPRPKPAPVRPMEDEELADAA
jgi:putative oxidoreductase